jgi:hypothetical protein
MMMPLFLPLVRLLQVLFSLPDPLKMLALDLNLGPEA